MKIRWKYENLNLEADLSQPLPIALTYANQPQNTRAWYLPALAIAPAELGDWIGSVDAGASVNFNTIHFNPHAHGTHTENVSHILPAYLQKPISETLRQQHFLAALVSVRPLRLANGDLVINQACLEEPFELLASKYKLTNLPALIIRTLPNDTVQKTQTDYSDQNPAYLTEDAMIWINKKGISHLLVDMPSVDKEKDAGALVAHRLFWNVPQQLNLSKMSPENPLFDIQMIDYQKTITEFIYAPDHIKDDVYLLNLMITPFANDACPSLPTLYRLVVNL
jgi:kynurenine formamidase